MRKTFWTTRIATVALLVALVVPTALAGDTAADPGLWAEFLTWLQGRIDIPNGIVADDQGFAAWLMGRIGIPGG